MKALCVRVALGIALAGGLSMPSGLAEEGTKVLPTLLIKGEVVSLDASDPSAALLKVKDRYGFETPIFLTADTTISQDGATLDSSRLAMGTPVEVEYNFDINTAKRHAVSVKVATTPPAAEAAPAAEAVPTTQVPAPVEVPAAEPAPAESSAPAEAPVTPDASAEPVAALEEELAPTP